MTRLDTASTVATVQRCRLVVILLVSLCLGAVGGCVREYIVRYDNPSQGAARAFKLDTDVGGRSISSSVKMGIVTPDDCAYGIYQIVTRVPAARRKTSIEVQCATPPIVDDDGGLGDDDGEDEPSPEPPDSEHSIHLRTTADPPS